MNTRLILTSLTAVALTACGGGSDNNNTGNTAPTNPPPTSTAPVTGNVTVTLSFPVAASSAPATDVKQQKAQTRSYISSKTQSVSITLTSVNGAAPTTPVGVTVDVKAGSACVVSGSNLNCTVTLAAPAGNDQFEVNTWPSTGAGGNMPLSSGTGTANVPANGAANLAVTLLPRVNSVSVEFTPGSGTQPIGTAGTITALIRGKDSAGDVITGADPYHDPIKITNKDIIGDHFTASPALPATFTSPAQDTITFTYDGAGSASSYAFYVDAGVSQTINLTLATNLEHVYVTQSGSNRINVYDIQSDGSLTGPSRSIVGSHTGLDQPRSIAVDSLGQIWVVNSNSLTVYAPGATDDATPLQTLDQGASPVYVSDKAGMIMTAPKDPNTGNKIYTVAVNYTNLFGTDPTMPSPLIPPFTVGSSAAVASILIGGTTGFVCATYNDTVDPNQNRVRCFTQPISWIVQQNALASDYPNIQIVNGAANWKYTAAFVDASDLKFLPNGALIVSSYAKYHTDAALETYDVLAGNPITSIHGSNTGVTAPGEIGVDSSGNLYLFDHGLSGNAGAVLQFAPGATGNVAPTHSITGLDQAGGIAIGK
jgi:hypothetical protein